MRTTGVKKTYQKLKPSSVLVSACVQTNLSGHLSAVIKPMSQSVDSSMNGFVIRLFFQENALAPHMEIVWRHVSTFSFFSLC